MAKDGGNNNISNSLNNIDQSVSTASDINSLAIQSASENNSQALQDLGNVISDAISNLGDGLKLTPKKPEKKEKDKELDAAKLKDELDGLRVFSPELGEIADTLIGINTEISSENVQSAEKKPSKGSGKKDEKEPEAVEINTSISEVSDLSGFVKITEITGNGFALIGNILKEFTGLFKTVVQGLENGQLATALLGESLKKSAGDAAEKAQKAAPKESKESGKNNLASFFQELAGPLNSVATGMLLLATSIAVLNAVGLNAQSLGVALILQAFMLTTFGALARISKVYQENAELIDTKGENPNSVTNIMKQFAIMVGLVGASMLLCVFLVDTIKESWQEMLLGLVMIFGTALATLFTLNIIAAAMSKLTGEDSDISQTLTSFTRLVFMVVGVALICALLHDTIMKGMGLTVAIFGGVTLLFIALMATIAAINIKAEQLEAFGNILKTVTVLVGLISVLAIVLGLLPTSVVVQGLIAITLIVALVDSVIFMLGNSIKKLEKVSAAKLKAFMGILITATVMIGLLGVLVVVLGSIPTATVIQGMLAVTVIAALPILIMKTMSKLANKAAQFAKALVGIVMATVLITAISAAAFLMITILGRFSLAQVLTSVVAVVTTTAALITVGALAVALAAASIPLAYATPFALAGIGLTSLLAVAIAGVALLLATILPMDKAQAALAAAAAIIVTTTALVVVAAGMITLAALAIPLGFASKFAITALKIIKGFLVAFAIQMSSTLVLISTVLANVDVSQLSIALQVISGALQGFVAMNVALLAFNIISATLVLQLGVASVTLGLINVGLLAFAVNYKLLGVTMKFFKAKPLDLTSLTTALTSLSSFNEVLNNFTAPSAAKLLAVSLSMGFVGKFSKWISKLASDDKVEKINNFANSLSKLASQANGLTDLAAAMREVAKASNELNNVNMSKISVEALSGSKNNATEMQKIQKTEKETDNTEIKEILASLKDVSSTLSKMLNSVDTVGGNIKTLSDIQESESRKYHTQYVK